MAATVKLESEVCALCNSAESGLFTPEEFVAGAAPRALPPMKDMLLHLAHNKPLPEGRICGNCAQRAVDAYEFSTQISSNPAQPLSEKIRNLRKRLHQLSQRVDVFIVVGAGSEGGYQEEDIIMVQKDKLAAAVAADEQRAAKWLREEYQCSVCPKSFKSMELLNQHLSSHSPGEVHSCWSCGLQFPSPDELDAHVAAHCERAFMCHLCNNEFQSAGALSAHAALCPAVCPLCACACVSHGALQEHARSEHAGALCALCFLVTDTEEARLSHLVAHRAGSHYACGAHGCLLRFKHRSSLTAHVRARHGAAARDGAAPLPPAPAPPHTSVGGLATRRRARNAAQQVEPQQSLVAIEPDSVPANQEASSPARHEADPANLEADNLEADSQTHEAASSDGDEDMAEHVEYLDMDTFDDY